MPIRFASSLRGRLLLGLTALFALLFAVLLLQQAEARRLAREAALERAQDLARGYAHHYERLLRDQLTMLETLLRLRGAGADGGFPCGDIRQFVVATPSLADLAVLDPSGRLRCAARTAAPGEAEARTARLALERRGMMLGMSGQGDAARPYLALAHPLTDEDGLPRAVILAYLDRDWLNARFADTVPAGVVLRILDGDGVFVVRQPDPECCVGKSGRALGGIGEAIAEGVAQVRQSTWLDGVVRLQADLPLQAPLSGVVSVGISEALALAGADRSHTRLAALLAALLLALYALSGWASQRYLLRPLRLLAEGTRRLREGDLAWRIADPAIKGEFAALARDFNAMAETIAADRRQLEQDLERLRLAARVFDQANEAITITDAEANILAVNRRFTEITGYAASEAVGRNPRILKSGRHDAAFYRAMWDALASAGHWSGEIWNRRKDGSVYPEWLSISAVRDEAGRILNYVAMFIDLTERKAAEEALRESEARHRLILDTTLDAVISMDCAGCVTEWNAEAERMFGYRRDAALGKPIADLIVPPQLRDAHRRGLRRFLDTGQSKVLGTRIETTAMRSNGSEFPAELAIATVGNGSGLFFSAFIRDITDRKRLEEEMSRHTQELELRVAERTQALESANRELEAFSYSVSHDLRAPLRAINGFSQLLEAEYAARLDAKGLDYLGRVRAASLKMGELIDDLLELSRVSRHVLKLEATDLSALAAEIAEELAAGEPDRRVDWSIAPGIVARCDPGLMRPVLANLLGNAWKYTSRREHAHIEFGLEDEGGRKVYFVRDDGAGFDMRYAAKLFGAFQRLHSPAEFPGTGIGLAIVARIVRRHGGEIWAESAPDQGATFRFTLPQ
jgi:PAS domain S-box-containing protein